MADSSGQMLAVGPFLFHIRSLAYQNMSLEDKWRWAEVGVLGRQVQHHFVGKGVSMLRLTGTLFPLFTIGGQPVGYKHVDEFRKQADAGTPFTVVTGYGEAWGQWCVTRVNSDRSLFFRNGIARKESFEIEMKNYDMGDSEPTLSQSSAASDPSASRQQTPGLLLSEQEIVSREEAREAYAIEQEILALNGVPFQVSPSDMEIAAGNPNAFEDVFDTSGVSAVDAPVAAGKPGSGFGDEAIGVSWWVGGPAA